MQFSQRLVDQHKKILNEINELEKLIQEQSIKEQKERIRQDLAKLSGKLNIHFISDKIAETPIPINQTGIRFILVVHSKTR
jgi:hypothetical protein